MNQEKYIGMDVHQATISVAVMDSSGKLIMECVLETKAATILEFIDGLRGTLSVTFEEGTSAGGKLIFSSFCGVRCRRDSDAGCQDQMEKRRLMRSSSVLR